MWPTRPGVCTMDAMRMPVDYLANLLADGDGEVIRDVLRRLAAMRGHMSQARGPRRARHRDGRRQWMTVQDVEDMYQL